MAKRDLDKETDPSITVRVPADWLDRADALARLLSDLEDVRRYAKPTRSMVARLAMLRGLEALERQYVRKSPAKAQHSEDRSNHTPVTKRSRQRKGGNR